MSYILDALTKAAQQRDRQVPVVQRLLSPAPRTRSPWSALSGRLLAALAINAILLTAVLVWWLRPTTSETPPPEPVAAPAPSPASPRPLVKLEPLPSIAAPTEKPSAPPSEPRADAAAAAKPSAPPPAVSPPPRVGTPTIQPAPATGPAPVASAPSASARGAPPAAGARSAAPPEAAALRVEALIYADTPAERMVFINGRRYREGDSIDGRLRIEEIKEEGVELSDQGRRFTLRVSR